MTDGRQQSDWKRRFTFGRALVILGAAATAIGGWITVGEKVLSFLSARSHEITLRDLKDFGTYEADLYDLDRQDRQLVWARAISPDKRGYVAKLQFVADKKTDAAVRGCEVQADATPMWTWLPPEPTQCDAKPGGEFCPTWPWLGTDRLWVGELPRGTENVEFEVFFQKKRHIEVRLLCEGGKPYTRWNGIDVNPVTKSGRPVFRIKGTMDPMDPSFRY